MIGGIFRATRIDRHGQAALVLTTGYDDSTQSYAVTLLSPDTELGGSADLVIAATDSGLAYDLLVESDIFGYLQGAQIGRKLGQLEPSVLDTLYALRNDDAIDTAVAGPPIYLRDDPRWTFKLAELDRIRMLTANP